MQNALLTGSPILRIWLEVTGMLCEIISSRTYREARAGVTADVEPALKTLALKGSCCPRGKESGVQREDMHLRVQRIPHLQDLSGEIESMPLSLK